MAGFGEPLDWTSQREQEAKDVFPTLQFTNPDTNMDVDMFRFNQQGLPPSDFSQSAMSLAGYAAQQVNPEAFNIISPEEEAYNPRPYPSRPEETISPIELAGMGVTQPAPSPYGTEAMRLPYFGPSEYTGTKARAPQAQPDILAAALRTGDIGTIVSETGTAATGTLGIGQALTGGPIFDAPGQAILGALKTGTISGALENIGSPTPVRGEEILGIQNIQNPILRGLAGFTAEQAANIIGFGGLSAAEKRLGTLGERLPSITWKQAAEDAMGVTRQAEMAAAPEAFQYGRGAGEGRVPYYATSPEAAPGELPVPLRRPSLAGAADFSEGAPLEGIPVTRGSEESIRQGLRPEFAEEPFPRTPEEIAARTEAAYRRSAGDVSPVSSTVVSADPETQLTSRIEDAKIINPIREENVAKLRRMQTAAGLAARQRGIEQGLSGEKLAAYERGAMRGQAEQPYFEPIRSYMSEDAVNSLYSKIDNSELQFNQQINAKEALRGILDGTVPRPYDLAQLESVIPGVTNSLQKAKIVSGPDASFIQKTADALNLVRTIRTAWDVSAPFRQGVMLAAGHPKEFFGNLPAMFKAFASENVANAIDESIRSSPNAAIQEDSGLFRASLDKASLAGREEGFISRLAAKYIPGIRASERALVTYLNSLRSNIFDSMWDKLPESSQTFENAQRLSRWINSATGRGSIPQSAQAWADVANGVLFSPRFLISRFEANGIGANAIFDMARKGILRQEIDPLSKQIASDYVKYLGLVSGAGALFAAGGANVDVDPRSSNFAKIKIGNTYQDISGGNAALMRYLAQLTSGERQNIQTGYIESYPRSKTLKNFIRSKLAPVSGLLWDASIGEGRTPSGVKLYDYSKENLLNIFYEEIAPLVAMDIVDAYTGNKQNFGYAGGLLGLPSAIGFGVTTINPQDSGAGSGIKMKISKPSLKTRVRTSIR